MSGGQSWYMNRNRQQLQAEQNPLNQQLMQPPPMSVANSLAAQFTQPEQQQTESQPEKKDQNDLMELLRKYWSQFV